MQGTHVFDPQARTVIDLESFVADNHFLRKVHRVLDISLVRDLTASCYAAGLGRPSIDPEIYFRMLLMAYLYLSAMAQNLKRLVFLLYLWLMTWCRYQRTRAARHRELAFRRQDFFNRPHPLMTRGGKGRGG